MHGDSVLIMIARLESFCKKLGITPEFLAKETAPQKIYRLWEIIHKHEIDMIKNGNHHMPEESRTIGDLIRDLFSEKRRWTTDELFDEVRKSGFTREDLYTDPDVVLLPIEKSFCGMVDGKRVFQWIAKKGWPS